MTAALLRCTALRVLSRCSARASNLLSSPKNPTRHLIFGSILWKLEVNALACQSLVDFRVCVESVVNATTLFLVKDDLQDLAAVDMCTKSLANNFHRVDEVGQDGIMDRGECSAARSLLGLSSAGAVASLWSWENATRCDDENVTIGELLLKLAGQAGKD